jgi:hypothetical protein
MGRHEAVENQPSARPTNKLVAASVTGAAVTLGLAVLDALSTESFHGAWWGSAVATFCASAAAYLRRNKVAQ